VGQCGINQILVVNEYMPRISSQNIFLQTVKDKCEEHNVKFILRNTNRININNTYVGGYFSEATKTTELVCATKSSEYESLLVHEFSHLEQWSEPYHVYKKVDKYTDDIDKWIAGKSVKNIEFKIDQIKLLELDCEKRAVKNIRKYELKIDIPTYIQKANCYILFHNYLKETRRWNKVHLIYSKELLKLCPTKFMSESYYSRIPKKIYRKFIELGI
jgi:hypothetical protein